MRGPLTEITAVPFLMTVATVLSSSLSGRFLRATGSPKRFTTVQTFSISSDVAAQGSLITALTVLVVFKRLPFFLSGFPGLHSLRLQDFLPCSLGYDTLVVMACKHLGQGLL